MNIGIMGAPVDNGNLGCMALTYTILATLEKISAEMNINFHYWIFDGTNRREKIEELAANLNISPNKISCARPGFWVPNQPKKFAKATVQNLKLLVGIYHCDCVIDVTAGDSFTDIYGQDIFDQRTNVKLLLKKFRKPLMLAPQTYGPFLSEHNVAVASKAIKYADVVISRDRQSTKVVKNIAGIDAFETYDLAFQLPYHRIEKQQCTEKIRVGLNVSGLLVANKTEQTEVAFKLKADYDYVIKQICNFFIKHSQYEVYLISHVEDDYNIHHKLKQEYPQMILVNKFTNPMEAKSFISGMDIFIGSRMHGTIAAFTSETACIPVAYSRKFAGVFDTVGYYRIVDLEKLETQDAADMIISYVSQYKQLKNEVKKCMHAVKENRKCFEIILKKWIKSVAERKYEKCHE